MVATGSFTPDEPFISLTEPSEQELVAVSDDAGRSWERLPPDRTASREFGALGGVHEAGRGFWLQRGGDLPVVSHSSDGSSWASVETPWSSEAGSLGLAGVVDSGDGVAFVTAGTDLVIWSWRPG